MLGLANTVSSGSPVESLYSMTLDGTDDYLDLKSLAAGLSLADNAAYSISLWFNTTDTSGSAGTNILVGVNGTSNDNVLRVGVDIAADGIFFNGTADGDNNVSIGSVDYVDGAWHHLALSRPAGSGENTTFYVDGSSIGTSAHDVLWSDTTLFSLGAEADAGTLTDHFQGKITDFAIWNTALDTDDITGIYNSGSPTNLTFNNNGYDKSSSLQAYYRMGNGSFDDKANGVIHDQHNPGFGAELIPNNDFSANEAESQANLVGGVQFDNWVENPGTGKRTLSVIENGFRSTCVETSDNHYEQRVRQDLHSILTVGDVYRFNCDYLTSDGSSIRVAIQTPGSGDVQIGGTQSTSAGVKYTLNGYFICSVTTNIDVDFWPTAVQSAGEYFEISNVSLKKLNGYPGLTSNVDVPTAFSSDTP